MKDKIRKLKGIRKALFSAYEVHFISGTIFIRRQWRAVFSLDKRDNYREFDTGRPITIGVLVKIT